MLEEVVSRKVEFMDIVINGARTAFLWSSRTCSSGVSAWRRSALDVFVRTFFQRLVYSCLRPIVRWINLYFLGIYLPGFYGAFSPELEELKKTHAKKNAWIQEGDALGCSRYPNFRVYRGQISHTTPREEEVVFSVVEAASFRPVRGKDVNICCYSLNEHRPLSDGGRWEPENIAELTEAIWSAIQEFREKKGEVNVLILFSVGALALHGLSNRENVPCTIILDRCIASSKKSAQKVFRCSFLGSCVYALAHLCGWSTDPEQGLREYYQSCQGDKVERRLIKIEVSGDRLLSNGGGFDPLCVDEMWQNYKVRAEQANFENYYLYKENMFHSLPLHYLLRVEETGGGEKTAVEFLSHKLICESVGGVEGGSVNIVCVGGNLDNADTIWSCRAEPLVEFMSEFVNRTCRICSPHISGGTRRYSV